VFDQLVQPAVMLQPAERPSQSDVLIHFCARNRPVRGGLPQDIAAMTPEKRLESILWEGQVRTFETFSGGWPAVCFTEAGSLDAHYLIARRGYAPWGLIFNRQTVHAAGGGSVWYARHEDYEALGRMEDGQLCDRLRTWAVRVGPGSDWTWESASGAFRELTAGQSPWANSG